MVDSQGLRFNEIDLSRRSTFQTLDEFGERFSKTQGLRSDYQDVIHWENGIRGRDSLRSKDSDSMKITYRDIVHFKHYMSLERDSLRCRD